MLGPIAGSVKDIARAMSPLAASGGDMPRGGEARQRVGEFFTVERLDQETVHSGLEQV